MAIKWTEYNDLISLRSSDIQKALYKARKEKCDYFMQLNLQGRGAWLGFKEPFESSVDRLYALYYKTETERGFVYFCLGLWREKPSPYHIYDALMSANRSIDAVINRDEVSDFISIGETKHLVFREPTHQPEYDFLSPYTSLYK